MILTHHGIVINDSIERGKRWFYDLDKYPENYKFDSHKGFKTISGKLGDVGCIIETKEKLGPIWIKNRFKFIEVCDYFFRLASDNTDYHFFCDFTFTRIDKDNFRLDISVNINNDTLLLNNYFTEIIINKQIIKELNHIKENIEKRR